jgi:hypothetical protein
MKSVFLPVLDETTVDGVEITKEWIEKYAPSMEGKPVNIDHNYFNSVPISIGKVDKVFFDTDGRLYAKISIQDKYYYKIMDSLEGYIDDPSQCFKGVSFEWKNEDGNAGFKGLSVCFQSIPKVDFAKLNYDYMIDTILASVKMKTKKTESETMNAEEIAKIVGDVIDKKLPDIVEIKVKEVLASQKIDNNTTEGNTKDDELKGIELLASKMDENTAVMKTMLKEISELRKVQKEINASNPAGAPPSGSGNTYRSANLGL